MEEHLEDMDVQTSDFLFLLKSFFLDHSTAIGHCNKRLWFYFERVQSINVEANFLADYNEDNFVIKCVALIEDR